MRFIVGIVSDQQAGGGGGGGLTLTEVGPDITPDPTYTFNDPDHELTSGGGANKNTTFIIKPHWRTYTKSECWSFCSLCIYVFATCWI